MLPEGAVRTIYLDFETRSLSPIKLVGGLNYVAAPSTDVLCLCASDGRERWVWTPFGLPDQRAAGFLVGAHVSLEPWELVAATEGAVLVAHNAEGFDRPVWESCFPDHPREWADSLPRARRAQLPGKLEALAAYVLGDAKNEGGRKVTLSLSKPVVLSSEAVDMAVAAARARLAGTWTPALGDRPLALLLGPSFYDREAMRSLVASPPYGAEVLPTPSAAQLTEVIRYCLQDVELLRRVCEAERLLEPHMDDDALEADRRVNTRGVAVDLALVDRLLARADAIVLDAGRRAHVASDGAIGEVELRSTAVLRSWINEQRGDTIEDVKAETIKPLLARELNLAEHGTSEVSRECGRVLSAVLAARLDVARVATGKLRALKHRTSADGRLRGAHGYYQAHTGRWAGRGVQTQNLPRAVKGADPERVGEATSEQVGSLIRQCFVGDPGLVVLDFKQIEARALLYLAGDLDGMNAFDDGDPYLDLAGRIFNDVVKKGDPRRQVAKVTILGSQYGAGPDALARYFAKAGVVTDLDPAYLVESYRSANPLIAGVETGREYTDEAGRLRRRRRGGYWKQLEKDARQAIRDADSESAWAFDGHDLLYTLPSGRVLRYREAQVGPFEDREDALTYFNPKKRKRVATWGSRLSENLAQAFSRDFLAEGLVRLEAAGERTVMHTHDEFVVEAAESELPRLAALVSEPPPWAPDFALGVEGAWARRYAK